MTMKYQKEEQPQKEGISRRRLLSTAGAGMATIALASGVTLISRAQATPQVRGVGVPASSKIRWGFLVNTNSDPSDWDTCVAACKKENGWTNTGHPNTDPQWIRKVSLKDKRTGATTSLPMMCQHCEYPPCVDVCPTGASMRRDDGIVLVDRHRCIGCRYCMMACPYGARSFVHHDLHDQRPSMPRGKGTVESCTLCVHRIDTGKNPACVDALQAKGSKAIIFGDLNDPNSEISREVARYLTTRIRDDLALEPGVLYRGL